MSVLTSAILIDFDFRVFRFFNGFAGKSELGDWLILASAEYLMFLMIAGLALFVLLKEGDRGRWILALKALLAAFLSRAIFVSLIRLFFFRARPFVAGVVTQLVPHNPLEGAFPSGHASVMFALAFSFFPKYKVWGIVYTVLAIVSGVSRVAAGVHFPFDILGGLLIAILGVFAARHFFDFWLSKRQNAPSFHGGLNRGLKKRRK